ncbi:MAG: GNAT family N-acetyltransferase [Rhodoferax sp.]
MAIVNQWHIARLSRGLGEYAAQWDDLNIRRFNAHPLLDSRFVDSLLGHFGEGSEHLCILTPNGEPEAMCLLQPGRLGIWRSFLPSQAQLGPALMPNPNALQDLMRSLPGIVTRLDMLCTDPELCNLSEGHCATTTGQNHALTMNIRLDETFERYWAQRSKNLKKNMERYERRLAADHVDRRFLCIGAPDAVGPAVARYAALESRGWKARLGTAISIDNRQGLFYTALLNRFSLTGNAMVFELWFGAQLAASRLVIGSADMLVILKTTYDEALERYAPGRQLLKAIIESLFTSHRGKVLEFYTDANADNLAWGTGKRWIKHVSVARSVIAENILQLLWASRQMLPLEHKPPELTSDTLGISVYHHTDEFPQDVQQFFDERTKDNVEFSAAWYRNLLNTVYHNHNGICIYVLRKGGRTVAALPLLVKKRLLGNGMESLGNYYSSIYAPLIDPDLKARDLAHLLNAAKEAYKPLNSFRFAPMDPESSSFCTLLEALHLSGFAAFRFFCFGNWHLRVNSDWKDYLQSREGKLRNTIRRMKAKLTAQGGVLELITNGSNLERGLAAYQQVYASSWKKPEPYPNFIPELIRTCAANNWLRLGVAWLNGVPIAAQIWIVANAKADIYKLAYDESYKCYAPGTLLTAMLMEHAIEKDQVTEVDYLIGDDSYKESWMSHRRERFGIMAYNPRTINGLFGLGQELLGRALKPLLKPLVSRIRKPIGKNTATSKAFFTSKDLT